MSMDDTRWLAADAAKERCEAARARVYELKPALDAAYARTGIVMWKLLIMWGTYNVASMVVAPDRWQWPYLVIVNLVIFFALLWWFAARPVGQAHRPYKQAIREWDSALVDWRTELEKLT